MEGEGQQAVSSNTHSDPPTVGCPSQRLPRADGGDPRHAQATRLREQVLQTEVSATLLLIYK